MQPFRQPLVPLSRIADHRAPDYHARAERVRRAAGASRFLEIRDQLLRLAAIYEKCAAREIAVPPADDESVVIFARCGGRSRED